MNTRNLMLGAATLLMMSAISPASAADLNTSTNANANAKGIINFDALDTDRNGIVSDSEFNASSSFKGSKFDDVDKNNDGEINGEELSIWARVHGKGNAVGTANGIVNTPNGVNVRGNATVLPTTRSSADSNVDSNTRSNTQSGTQSDNRSNNSVNTGVKAGANVGIGVNGVGVNTGVNTGVKVNGSASSSGSSGGASGGASGSSSSH